MKELKNIGPLWIHLVSTVLALTLAMAMSPASAGIRLVGWDETKLRKDDVFEVNVRSDDLRGLLAGDFRLTYDRNLLKVLAITLGPDMPVPIQPFNPNLDRAEQIIGGFAYLDPLDGASFVDVTVFTMRFQVRDVLADLLRNPDRLREYQEKSHNGKFDLASVKFDVSRVINEEEIVDSSAISAQMTLVPEPSTWMLMLGGVGVLVSFVRARRRHV